MNTARHLGEAPRPNKATGDATVGIDQDGGRPKTHPKFVEVVVIVVDRDRPVDPKVAHGAFDVVDVGFKQKFRRVHPDYLDGMAPVGALQDAEVSQERLRVVAGVGPKVHHDDFAGERAKSIGFDVDPVAGFDVRGD